MDKQLTPQLRFPEFDRKWEEEKLVNLSKKVAYGMNAAATTFDGVNKYLRITDIDEDSRSFIPKPLSSPDGEIEDKFILKKGDIVFARTGASVGKSYLYNEDDGKLLYAGFLIKFNISNAVPYFVFLQTFRESYRKWVQVYSMRSGQPGLNAEEYKLLKFNCPNIEEQQKIAAFLTDVDNKITKLTKKKELLEQYKKGIMQKIFNQELRFKDDNGNEFPNWQMKKLGDVLDYEQPTKYIVESTEYDDSFKTPVLTAGKSFLLGYTNETEGIYNKLPTIIFDDFTMANKYVDFEFKVKSSAMKILHPKTEEVNIQFVFKAIQMINYPKGDEHKRFWISEYSKIKIGYPCEKEQTKIANFLSDIDLKIEALNTKIENSKTFKKGLLQQMFV